MEFYVYGMYCLTALQWFQFPTGWNSTFVDLRRSWNSLLFQFPTGWNSTDTRNFVSVWTAVSIPNGMEFYSLYHSIINHHYAVSIPNGMEFYTTLTPQTSKKECFNSQRDGILRCCQIWKFYCCCVSIPNGMEFYKEGASSLLSNVCFNSQRDGILPMEAVGTKKMRAGFNSQRDGILQGSD